jgi:hypothetical protein
MKSWEQTSPLERRIFSGRKPREVIRMWDCARRKRKNEPCEVFDYVVFGRPNPS